MFNFKKALLCAALAGAAALPTCVYAEEQQPVNGNILTMAVAYKATAAEYEALYYQGFNIAQNKVAQAVAKHKKKAKPLAVITDVDDTIALHKAYWGYLIKNGKDFFDDPIWDKYIPTNQLEAAPGAVDFLNYCKANNVEVFYVTSRDQGEGTYEMALENLKALGFPYADKEHLTVLIDTSNKETKQKEIAAGHEVVVMLGDSLNDFQRKYYVKDVDQRRALMAEDKALYGNKFIVMPNPTDGHWIRAIFGESEPAPTDENRAKWVAAATRKVLK